MNLNFERVAVVATLVVIVAALAAMPVRAGSDGRAKNKVRQNTPQAALDCSNQSHPDCPEPLDCSNQSHPNCPRPSPGAGGHRKAHWDLMTNQGG